MAGSAAKDRVVYPLQEWAVNPIVPLEHDLGIRLPATLCWRRLGVPGCRNGARRASRGASS